jgi:flagellar basal body rod protein FlgC
MLASIFESGNEGMDMTKEAPEVPSSRKRKVRQRNRRRNNQQDSDPAHKQAEKGGLPSTYNLNNVSTVCLSDERNREAVFLSDNGETKLVNKGMETSTESLEVPSLRKRKARKRSKRRNNQQDSDPAHKQAEEGGMVITHNLNNVSTVSLSDERNREAVFLSDNGETKLVNKGMETIKESLEVPSSQKRKARKRSKRRNNQQDSDPAHMQAEEGGMLSTCNLNNVSTVCLSDERNKEAVFLSDNGETKLVNKGMETSKESLEVPSLRKKKARKRSKRRNNQQDSDPASKQAEESGLPSTNNLNNASTVCLSHETNREVALLSNSGKTKLVNKGMETTKEAPEVHLQKRKARRRNRRRNNQQDSDPAHMQAEEGGMLSTYNLNSVSTVCLSDETDREVVFLSDKGETKLVNKGMETTKEASEVPSLQKTKARRRNRRGNNRLDRETCSASLAIRGKENVPPESLSCLLEITPICLVRKKLLILDINGVLVDIVSPPPKGYIADIKIAKKAGEF